MTTNTNAPTNAKDAEKAILGGLESLQKLLTEQSSQATGAKAVLDRIDAMVGSGNLEPAIASANKVRGELDGLFASIAQHNTQLQQYEADLQQRLQIFMKEVEQSTKDFRAAKAELSSANVQQSTLDRLASLLKISIPRKSMATIRTQRHLMVARLAQGLVWCWLFVSALCLLGIPPLLAINLHKSGARSLVILCVLTLMVACACTLLMLGFRSLQASRVRIAELENRLYQLP